MERNDLGVLVKILNTKVTARVDASLKEFDLTQAQTRVLEYVHLHGGVASQKGLEEYLNVSHATVAGLVLRLEKNGFLTTYNSSEDRRAKIIQITEKARSMQVVMKEILKKNQDCITDGFTEKEVEVFAELLVRAIHNIDS